MVCCPRIPLDAISSPQTHCHPAVLRMLRGSPAESKPPPTWDLVARLECASLPSLAPRHPRSGLFHLQRLAGALSLCSRAWAPRGAKPHGAGTAAGTLEDAGGETSGNPGPRVSQAQACCETQGLSFPWKLSRVDILRCLPALTFHKPVTPGTGHVPSKCQACPGTGETRAQGALLQAQSR